MGKRKINAIAPMEFSKFGNDAEQHDLMTDTIIQKALREEMTEKAKKEGKHEKEKGMTLEEVEKAEGGVVRESGLGMAQTKRAATRKGIRAGKAGDTELLPEGELKRAEEDLEVEEEDGMTLEPFNLTRERAEGHFDESGHYVEHKADEGDRDAWLDSASVVSEAVRQQIEAREAAAAAAADALPMSSVQVAEHQATIASLLKRELNYPSQWQLLQDRELQAEKWLAKEGETVTRGLKRLGALAAKPRRGKQSKAPAALTLPAALTEGERQNAGEAFDKLTEASSSLMDSGELDVYSKDKASFERSAALFAPKPMAASAVGEDDMFGDEVEDMFAADPGTSHAVDESSPSKPHPVEAVAALPSLAASDSKARTGSGVGGLQAASSTTAAGAQAADKEQRTDVLEAVDYGSWPIRELRRFLIERGQDPSGIVEKGDLVSRVRAAAEAGPEGEPPAAPSGYEFDAASGYYWSSAAGMYYDKTSGCYYDGSKWYSYDSAASGFVEWPAGTV